MRTGTHPPKGRSLYRLLSFTILAAIMLSLVAPYAGLAQTSGQATTTTISAQPQTVDGPNGTFVATVLQVRRHCLTRVL